jgi:hypothetical protein
LNAKNNRTRGLRAALGSCNISPNPPKQGNFFQMEHASVNSQVINPTTSALRPRAAAGVSHGLEGSCGWSVSAILAPAHVGSSFELGNERLASNLQQTRLFGAFYAMFDSKHLMHGVHPGGTPRLVRSYPHQ